MEKDGQGRGRPERGNVTRTDRAATRGNTMRPDRRIPTAPPKGQYPSRRPDQPPIQARRNPTPQIRPYPAQNRPSATQSRQSPTQNRQAMTQVRQSPTQTRQSVTQTKQAPTQVRQSPTQAKSSQTVKPFAAVDSEESFRDVLRVGKRESASQRRIRRLLALVYAFVYAACAFLMIHPLNVLTARMPVALSAIVRALLPPLTASELCAAFTWPLFPDDRRMMFFAHCKLWRPVLAVLIALQALIWGEWKAQGMVLRFALQFAAPPLLVGTAVSVLVAYLDWLWYEYEEEEDA